MQGAATASSKAAAPAVWHPRRPTQQGQAHAALERSAPEAALQLVHQYEAGCGGALDALQAQPLGRKLQRWLGGIAGWALVLGRGEWQGGLERACRGLDWRCAGGYRPSSCLHAAMVTAQPMQNFQGFRV